MSEEARKLHRTIRASVREMLSVYHIQAKAGPVTDKALEQIIFRAAHPIVRRLAPYSAEQRAALVPNIVQMMLAAFLDSVTARTRKQTGRRGSEETMSKALPEMCPRVPDNPTMDGERCGVPAILEDQKRHSCYLTITHDSKHVCWCGRDWAAR